MEKVEKINFPYCVEKREVPKDEKMVIFFGTDFYNLPVGSNRENYIIVTNKMLGYIRKHFEGFQLVYQAHPNEQEEFQHLDLSGFKIGERKVAEIFLFENASSIEYAFSTCSWANGSAFAMGINSAVFLDLLKGSISDESIAAYHSYFEGLPSSFFIKSFENPPPKQEHQAKLGENDGLNKIIKSVGNSKKVWVLATDPALALRGAILGKYLKQRNTNVVVGLILISNNRWQNIKEGQHLFDVFDEVIEIPRGRIIYSARPRRIIEAIKAVLKMRRLPINLGDTLISFSNLLFEENCLLSFYKDANKILFLESRWYFFIYEKQYEMFPKEAFHHSFGQYFFNIIMEPLLGIHRTVYRELRDGKVINVFRYQSPLADVYDSTFILMPDKL